MVENGISPDSVLLVEADVTDSAHVERAVAGTVSKVATNLVFIIIVNKKSSEETSIHV